MDRIFLWGFHWHQPPWENALLPPFDLEWNAITPTTTKYIEQALAIYQACILALEACPPLRLTLSISGNALNLILKKSPSLIEELLEFLRLNRIELLGTSYTHAFLPFLSREDLIWDLAKHQDLLVSLFDYKPIGFFSPEGALSPEVLDTIADLGFHYLLGEDWCTLACPACSLDKEYCQFPLFPRRPFMLRGQRKSLIYLPRRRPRSIWRTSLWGILDLPEPQFIAELAPAFIRDFMEHDTPIEIMFTDGEIYGGGKRLYKTLPRLIDAIQKEAEMNDLSVSWQLPQDILLEGINQLERGNLCEYALSTSSRISWNRKFRTASSMSDGYSVDGKLMDMEFAGIITDGWDYWQEFQPNYLLANHLMNRYGPILKRNKSRGHFALADAARKLAFTSCWYGWHPTEWRILMGLLSFYLFHLTFMECQKDVDLLASQVIQRKNECIFLYYGGVSYGWQTRLFHIFYYDDVGWRETYGTNLILKQYSYDVYEDSDLYYWIDYSNDGTNKYGGAFWQCYGEHGNDFLPYDVFFYFTWEKGMKDGGALGAAAIPRSEDAIWVMDSANYERQGQIFEHEVGHLYAALDHVNGYETPIFEVSDKIHLPAHWNHGGGMTWPRCVMDAHQPWQENLHHWCWECDWYIRRMLNKFDDSEIATSGHMYLDFVFNTRAIWEPTPDGLGKWLYEEVFFVDRYIQGSARNAWHFTRNKYADDLYVRIYIGSDFSVPGWLDLTVEFNHWIILLNGYYRFRNIYIQIFNSDGGSGYVPIDINIPYSWNIKVLLANFDVGYDVRTDVILKQVNMYAREFYVNVYATDRVIYYGTSWYHSIGDDFLCYVSLGDSGSSIQIPWYVRVHLWLGDHSNDKTSLGDIGKIYLILDHTSGGNARSHIHVYSRNHPSRFYHSNSLIASTITLLSPITEYMYC